MGDEQRVRREISVETVINFGLLGLSQVCGLLTGIVLSRMLGADGLGTYLWCWSVANVLGIIAKLGLEMLLVREIAISKAQGHWGLLRGIVRFAQRSSAGLSLVLGALAVALGALWLDTETWHTLMVAMGVMVVMSSVGLVAAGVRGLGAVSAANVPIQGVRAVGLLGLLALLWKGGWQLPPLAMGAHLFAWIAAWAVAMLLWRRILPHEARHASPEGPWRPWLRSSAPLLLMTSMNMLQNQASVLLLKGLADDASTGIYGVVAQLAVVTSSVLIVLNSVILPRFAVLHAAGRRRELQSLVSFAAVVSTAASGLFTAAMIALGPTVLSLYGEGFEAGLPALLVLLVGQSVAAVAGSVTQLMVMTGHERELGGWSILSAGLSIALNGLLIPQFGLVGAALATGTVLVVINAILVVRVRQLLGLDSTVFGVFTR
ncbi:MAG: oligosaccharide flippase family protein [Myxococcota bacterium]